MNLNSYKIIPHLLHFKQPAGTSRSVLRQRQTYFLIGWNEEDPEQNKGWGEIAPLDGLSKEPDEFHTQVLSLSNQRLDKEKVKEMAAISPSFRFALESVQLDYQNQGKRTWFAEGLNSHNSGIPINGLIWMGNKEEMYQRIREKLNAGYPCLKLKIGGIDFEEECSLLAYIRENFGPDNLELRLDANGSFTNQNAEERLKILSDFHIHSIEQPIRAGQEEEMAALCEAKIIPIALDEELIGFKSYEKKTSLIRTIQPQYLIFKPSLIGGIKETQEYIELCQKHGIGWWITSALESNVGLNILAQFCLHLNVSRHQGLGTGKLYTNNIVSPLREAQGKVFFDPNGKWGNIENPDK